VLAPVIVIPIAPRFRPLIASFITPSTRFGIETAHRKAKHGHGCDQVERTKLHGRLLE